MFSRIRQSLFVKLLAIFVLTGILLIVLLAMGLRWAAEEESQFHVQLMANVNQYIGYLISDIGNPPQQENIDQVAEKTGLKVFVYSKEAQYKSKNSGNTDVSNYDFHDIKSQPLAIAHYRGSSGAKMVVGHHTYIFIVNHRRLAGNSLLVLIVVSSVISIVIAFSYLLVRRLFRPIKALNQGFANAAAGNLGYEITPTSSDELGRLTHSFNDMTRELNALFSAKTQLLRDISHELRSPLTRIKLASEMLDDQRLKDSINEEVRILNELIEDILLSSRLQSGRIELYFSKFDLGDLLESIVRRNGNVIPGIELSLPQEPIYIDADIKRIRTALQNVIENALKYSMHQTRHVEIKLHGDSKIVCIDIIDYGQGIKVADQSRIFNAFTRLDPSRNHAIPGYGLGLNIAKNIIELHGGTISLESDGEQYTRFTVELPIVNE
ncbi:MAG: HAMP domain-containing histidine kinase [Gammaproteobacteria bacterium]|nr:HAMP domain-containing histidine kinase [Gammaproteobacteria bacterium]